MPPVVKVRFCSVSIMSGGVEQETLLETLLGLGGGRASFLAAVSCVLEMRLGDSLLLLLEGLVLVWDSSDAWLLCSACCAVACSFQMKNSSSVIDSPFGLVGSPSWDLMALLHWSWTPA